jgi:hypothetical protein
LGGVATPLHDITDKVRVPRRVSLVVVPRPTHFERWVFGLRVVDLVRPAITSHPNHAGRLKRVIRYEKKGGGRGSLGAAVWGRADVRYVNKRGKGGTEERAPAGDPTRSKLGWDSRRAH